MTTNHAFIKAYRQDAPQPHVMAPRSADTRNSSGVPSTHIDYVTVGTTHFAATFDTGTASQLPETWTFAAPPTPPQSGVAANAMIWPTCEAPFGRIDKTPTIGKRPLSAFTSQRFSTATNGGNAERRSRLQPATTVASFSWPPVCRKLCQQFGRDFDRVGEMLIRHADQGRSVVGVMGLFRGIGSTTILLCLAARLALRDRRAILLEGNFASPRMAEWLDAVPTASWQDVLERGLPVSDAIIRATERHLDLLPLGGGPSDPERLAESRHVAETASVLRSSYDIVLVDLGAFFDPITQPVALKLMRNMPVDAVLAVAGSGGADPRDLTTLCEYLDKCGCELLGTIENRSAQLQSND
jgi:Mrp family chromosome partitioning ATPase